MDNPVAVWVGAFVTLAIFSYLVRDNPVFRLVQNAALGLSVGFSLVIAWQQVLEPLWWRPISAALRGEARWTGALWLLALVPGSLWYFQLSRKWFWVSSFVVGLFIGAAAGLTLKGQMLLVLPQIEKSLKPLNPFAGPQGLTAASAFTCLSNLIFLATLFATLFYFFFSVKADHPVLRPTMRFGRLMIMVALGAMFGNTVMTRMGYLIDRLRFLANDWLAPLLGLS